MMVYYFIFPFYGHESESENNHNFGNQKELLVTSRTQTLDLQTSIAEHYDHAFTLKYTFFVLTI